MRRGMTRWLALGLVVLVVGCGGSGEAKPGTPGEEGAAAEGAAVTPAGKPLPPELAAIVSQVAEVRELDAPATLDYELVRRSDLPALLEGLITDDDREWFAETTTLYRLLGHLRDDQDFLTVYQSFGADAVLGLYSPVEKKLWVVHEDGDAPDFADLPRPLKDTLVHEVVHAIQDWHFDLTKTYEEVGDDLDRNLAWTSVVEGDAVTHENLYGRKYGAVPVAGGRAFLLADLQRAQDVPASITRELFFPYTKGAEFIRGLRTAKGTAAVNALLAKPLGATAYVLHPELLDRGWTRRDVQVPDLAGALGPGWRRESGGTLGEFHLGNYLQVRIRGSEAASAAAGLAGDGYGVYVREGESVAVFRAVFESEGEAREFAAAQEAAVAAAGGSFRADGGLQVATTRDGKTTASTGVRGSEVLFAIGSTREAAVRALQALVNG